MIRDQICACLGRLRQEGQSIIIVDKHIKKLAALADRFYVIDKGRIPFQCRPSDLSADDPADALSRGVMSGNVAGACGLRKPRSQVK